MMVPAILPRQALVMTRASKPHDLAPLIVAILVLRQLETGDEVEQEEEAADEVLHFFDKDLDKGPIFR